MELKAGNRAFEMAAKSLDIALALSKQQEVVFFMTHFVPSCGSTLDELMKTN